MTNAEKDVIRSLQVGKDRLHYRILEESSRQHTNTDMLEYLIDKMKNLVTFERELMLQINNRG